MTRFGRGKARSTTERAEHAEVRTASFPHRRHDRPRDPGLAHGRCSGTDHLCSSAFICGRNSLLGRRPTMNESAARCRRLVRLPSGTVHRVHLAARFRGRPASQPARKQVSIFRTEEAGRTTEHTEKWGFWRFAKEYRSHTARSAKTCLLRGLRGPPCLNRAASLCFCERSVGRHEALDHRHDQLGRGSDRLSRYASQKLRIRDEVPMNRGRQGRRRDAPRRFASL